MSEPQKKKAAYDDLFNIPENMTGEIINGELVVTPRPSKGHALASSYLGAEVIPPYCLGRGGGPGGWVILAEPEIQFGENILVPHVLKHLLPMSPVCTRRRGSSACNSFKRLWIPALLTSKNAGMTFLWALCK